ncbi:MAG: type II toxin-antitoxin system VapC family toxin [Desulfobacterales bacterium]
MITAVDTNVLVDVLEPDPIYGPRSKELLKQCLLSGSIVACDVVWAEVATVYGHACHKVVEAMNMIGVQYSAMNLEAALAAAKCWFAYRQKGGRRNRIASDFLIGGHARIQCDQLLTRDRGFYREYFTQLQVLSP